MDTKAKGIILKLSDYKEADKIASVFTFEEGIISAKFVGVKKDKAKMKSVAQPFVFADFVFNEKGNLKTVTSANVIDAFPKILADYNRTICGYIMLDATKSLLLKDDPQKDIFLLLVSSLKDLEVNNPYATTIDFLIKFISFSGMGLEFESGKTAYLDEFTGNFVYERKENTMEIDKKVSNSIKNIVEGKEMVLNDNVLKQALRLLRKVIYLKFNTDILSFDFI